MVLYCIVDMADFLLPPVRFKSPEDEFSNGATEIAPMP